MIQVQSMTLFKDWRCAGCGCQIPANVAHGVDKCQHPYPLTEEPQITMSDTPQREDGWYWVKLLPNAEWCSFEFRNGSMHTGTIAWNFKPIEIGPRIPSPEELAALQRELESTKSDLRQELLVSDRLRISWREDVETERKKLAEHRQHVQRFLQQMYATMIDPVEDATGTIADTCKLLLEAATRDRQQLSELAELRTSAGELATALMTMTREADMLRRDRDALRKAINNVFGGMGKTSAIWGNSPYDKGHTAGVLAALTAFDTECKRIDATLGASKSDAEKEQHGR